MDENFFKTFFTQHELKATENINHKFILQYKVIKSDDNTFFNVKVACLCKNTFNIGISAKDEYKNFDTNFESHNAIMSINAHIDHHRKEVRFGGYNGVRIIYCKELLDRNKTTPTLTKNEILTSTGVGTTAFNELVKFVKHYAPEDYKVGSLLLSTADEGNNHEDALGKTVNNKIRRNTFYENFGFDTESTESYATIKNVAALKEHSSTRCEIITLKNFIEQVKDTNMQLNTLKDDFKSLKEQAESEKYFLEDEKKLLTRSNKIKLNIIYLIIAIFVIYFLLSEYGVI